MNKFSSNLVQSSTKRTKRLHYLFAFITAFLAITLHASGVPEHEEHQRRSDQACRAVRTNNVTLLEKLIEENPYLTNHSEIFHLAVALAKLKTVRHLLRLGFKANCIDKHGRTALHALCNPHLIYNTNTIETLASLVDLLVEGGADIDGEDRRSSPLFLALSNRQSELVEILLSYQPHLCTERRKIASHLAAALNDLDSLKHILFLDPDLTNMQDLAEHTPLDIALIKNYKEITLYLLSRSDLDLDTLYWALFHAIDASTISGRMLQELLKKLVAEEPDALNGTFRYRSFHGTALHRAALRGNLEHVRTLLKFGAKVLAKNDADSLPLHIVASKASNNTCAIAELLLQQGPGSINWRNTKRQTALSLAVKNGDEMLALFLLNRGAQADRAVGGLKRLRHYAAEQGLRNLLDMLK